MSDDEFTCEDECGVCESWRPIDRPVRRLDLYDVPPSKICIRCGAQFLRNLGLSVRDEDRPIVH
jgi:hypothetical protein